MLILEKLLCYYLILEIIVSESYSHAISYSDYCYALTPLSYSGLLYYCYAIILSFMPLSYSGNIAAIILLLLCRYCYAIILFWKF